MATSFDAAFLPGLPVDPPEGFRGIFRTDDAARARYAEGAGIARDVPCAVAVPKDVEDVACLIAWAKATGTPVMPRGSASGMAAGAIGPYLSLDLSRLQQIGPVLVEANGHRGRVTAQAGAVRADVDRVARAVGLRFPVDPSSGAFCTVGGMAATNAAGARSLRFGATRPWVTGLECVFDDGTSAWIRRGEAPPTELPAVARLVRALEEIRRGIEPHHLVRPGVRKESSGYGVAAALASGGHLVDLLVGSEGTLAVFTAVELALCAVAGHTASVLVTFDRLEEAAACAVEAREAGASACELLDRTFLDIAETGGPTGIPRGAEAVLLIEVEGRDVAEAIAAQERVTNAARRHGATAVQTASDPDAEHQLWALRHAASPILAGIAPRLRSMQFIEDGCVPPDRFPAYVRGVREALRAYDMTGVIFGHAGDAHAHVNPLVDVTASGWRDRVHGLLDRVVELTVSLGGTLAGEHGDGRLRAPFWPVCWSLEARGAFAHVKGAADPSGVLNPGCKVATADARPFAVLRHDPEAAELPGDAPTMLAAIERERQWSRFRLEGLSDS